NLGAEILADSNGAELVVPIVGNHDLAGGDQRADFLGSLPLVFGDLGHLDGDVSLTCRFNLGHRITSADALAPASTTNSSPHHKRCHAFRQGRPAPGSSARSAPDVQSQ